VAINCTRSFNAAHDRYLEPPEIDDSDEEYDEDAEHDKRRQRQLDEEDWIATTMMQRGECDQ